MLKRAIVVYRGNVQGVGFRYTACHIAREYEVAGFVKNVADGTVRIVVEGEEAEVTDFLHDVRQRMDHFIASEEIRWQAAEKNFADFEIGF
jgi:acylphosphatase